ncbi:hypothetical protein BT67DRAFT_481305 [Trichocladium antarcticum]|uniref:Amidoligase enzyme n=1 Tax=Trichocladium antarcticum TaxID=1450529 RepID=A0AAN6ZAW0_9PEZI|nr:hypothetical protein BT67DRAFT_481305 [Trichocladium antarcticum]
MDGTGPERQNGLSFGIELEFLFYYQPEQHPSRKVEVYTDSGEAKLAPALVFPNTEGKPVREWALDRMRTAILKVPGAQVKDLDEETVLGAAGAHRHMYLYPDSDGWHVKDDGSVDDQGETPPGYEVLSFEMTSPALWDKSESYRHVHAVVAELTRRFRLRVNLTTGFHCHVGAGSRPKGKHAAVERERRTHSRKTIKRAAALLWAADSFLCHIHPPERSINNFSPPTRFHSSLATGTERKYAKDQHGNWSTVDAPIVANPAPFQRSGLLPEACLPSRARAVDHAARRRDGARLPALRSATLDAAATARVARHGADPAPALDPASVRVRTVLRGVEHLAHCASRTAVAEVMGTRVRTEVLHRLNYNFESYKYIGHGDDVFMGPPASGTVEFREAAGALSPEWVALWAGVCAGIFRFARGASDARFRTVVDQLARAEAEARVLGAAAAAAAADGQHRYDAVALLADLGLLPEAVFLARRLADDPVRFWYPNRLALRPEEPLAASPVWRAEPESWGGGSAGTVVPDANGSPSAQSTPFVSTPFEPATGAW